MADIVAKRFCSSKRARSIQDRAPMRNVDSKIHAARFYCFKFLFHSFATATFATKSAHSGQANAARNVRSWRKRTLHSQARRGRNFSAIYAAAFEVGAGDIPRTACSLSAKGK